MSFHDVIRRLALLSLSLLIAALQDGRAIAGPSYNAVTDFSLSGNPNGAWSYGTLSAATGGTLSAFADTSTNVIYTGQQQWNNGGTQPNESVVERNDSGSSVGYGTVTLPTNLLRLDGQNFIDDVRWTAPTTGVYDVSGYFQRIDSNSGVYVDVGVNLNGVSEFSQDNFYGGSATQQSFNLSALSLKAGDVLDFYEAPAQYAFDSTGLSAQITQLSTVPEPSSLAMAALGLSVACACARAKARASAIRS